MHLTGSGMDVEGIEIRHYRCAVMYIRGISGRIYITCDQSSRNGGDEFPFGRSSWKRS